MNAYLLGWCQFYQYVLKHQKHFKVISFASVTGESKHFLKAAAKLVGHVFSEEEIKKIVDDSNQALGAREKNKKEEGKRK